jgi:prepilin-type N-terminal cleavage/methylation domain-containing protein
MMPRMREKKRQRIKQEAGFTLVEVLITLSVMGILASAAIPNIVGLLERQQMQQGISQVESLIHQSRQYALSQGLTISVQFDEPSNTITACESTLESQCNGRTIQTLQLDSIKLTNSALQSLKGEPDRSLAFDFRGHLLTPEDVLQPIEFRHSRNANLTRSIFIVSILGTTWDAPGKAISSQEASATAGREETNAS